MRRLVFALLCGLVLVPLPVHAQGSVTLTVCNTGTVDIDVFVSGTGTHIRPATCVAVAQAAGATQPAYIGIAFTDSRGQWGTARRFDGVPYMGVKGLPAGAALASRIRGETVPTINVLSQADRSETVRHRNANVSLPMQLLFQPRVPECVGSGTTVPDELRRVYVGRAICEDLGYTLNVEAYPDSREIRLGAPPVSGALSTDGAFRISPKTDVNWVEVEGARKSREAPAPVNWSDLLSMLGRMGGRERLSSGEPLRLPSDIVVRGTVSAVEIRQQPLDSSFRSWRPTTQPFDANATIPVAEINFNESPLAAGRQYPQFNVCTERLDILTEQFGADFRTGMIGKVIEVRGVPNLLGTVCWGQWGEIQIFLARQVRQVQSAQFAAGTRVWVPPPVNVPPARPAPPPAPSAAEAERQRQYEACFNQALKDHPNYLRDGEQFARWKEAQAACMKLLGSPVR